MTVSQVNRRKHTAERSRTALVHYWLVGTRGGERVLEALCRMFPEADVYTNVYVPSAVSTVINSHRVRTTYIQRLPFSSRLYQAYVPLMPAALERLDLRGYDLVISSESGPAKNVIVDPDALHLCYCHSPMRYLWDQAREYADESGLFVRAAMGSVSHFMRLADVTSAARVDGFVANSRFVAARIRKYWRRDAVVVPPPVDIGRFALNRSHDGYYLWLGKLVRYKRPDIAVDAFTKSGKPLIVAGDGPELRRLRGRAGNNIVFFTRVSDEGATGLLERCRAFLLTGVEDFGIAPVEAMACGKPVIAYRRGGALDTVRDGVSGLFFNDATADSLASAVETFESSEGTFDPARIRKWAEQFNVVQFQKRFLGVLNAYKRGYVQDADRRNKGARGSRSTFAGDFQP